MREFTFVLARAPNHPSASYQVQVGSERRAYELAKRLLGHAPKEASIEILEGDLLLGTVNGESAA